MPPAALFALAAATAVSAGASIYNSQQGIKASKNAANDAAAQNAAAIQSAKDAQDNAGTKAAAAVRQRVSGASQTVYTSPLGLSGDASVVRKTLLGE